MLENNHREQAGYSPENRLNPAWLEHIQTLDSEDSIRILRKVLTGMGQKEEEISRNIAAAVIYRALIVVNKSHRALGEDGKAKNRVNRFGEMALSADISAEETLLSRMEIWAKAEGLRIIYRGEELGEGVIGEEDGKAHFVVFDGLDGSANYLQPGKWPYGTMVAVAKGVSPTYEDFEVAGVLLPEEGMLVRAIKGKGVFVNDLDENIRTSLNEFQDEPFDDFKVLADDYFPEAQKLLGEKRKIWPRTGSTAASIVALAIDNRVRDILFPVMNEGWQVLIEVTRKGNLEQPVLYRIIRELGGVMVDKDGNSIGQENFDDWGQESKELVVTAKSLNLAKAVLKQLTITP